MPEDVAGEPAEGEPLHVERARRPSPDRSSLARLKALWDTDFSHRGLEIFKWSHVVWNPVTDVK